MKLDSKYFDMIRIRRPAEAAARRVHQAQCQWRGCTSPGTHRAPRNRGRDGEYLLLCAEHVREFNASYDYFDGMSNAEIEAFQKSASYGHRPTWKLGQNVSGSAGADDRAGSAERFAAQRTVNVQSFHAWRAKRARSEAQQPIRQVKPLERKALERLDLPVTAERGAIKARFKELVKRHHPDANGGDRGAEDKLRDIIQAYNYLKQAGLV